MSAQPQPKEGFIVAEAGDEVAGFIYAAVRSTPLYRDDFEPDAGCVSVFFVHPAWHRQGIGTALVQTTLDYVRARGRAALAISPYARTYFWLGPDVDWIEPSGTNVARGGVHSLRSSRSCVGEWSREGVGIQNQRNTSMPRVARRVPVDVGVKRTLMVQPAYTPTVEPA